MKVKFCAVAEKDGAQLEWNRSWWSEWAGGSSSFSYRTWALRYKEKEGGKEEEKVSIDRVKLFIVINYRSLSAAGSSALRPSWKRGKRALLKLARASLFHVPRQRESSSLVRPESEKNTHTHTHQFASPPPSLYLSARESFGEARALFTGRLCLAPIDAGSMACAD